MQARRAEEVGSCRWAQGAMGTDQLSGGRGRDPVQAVYGDSGGLWQFAMMLFVLGFWAESVCQALQLEPRVFAAPRRRLLQRNTC
jgi:hypothetical protein